MVDPESFAGREAAMVYIAGRVGEAKRVERVLSERLIDYVVEKEPYQIRLLGVLPVQYDGLAFYVLSDRAGDCRRALREAGLTAGLVEEESG